METKRQELISGDLWHLMFKLSLPAIVAMMVIGLYSLVDAIFVGKWVGDAALGAIAVAYPFTLINNGVAVLVGMGSASLLSRAIGSEDQATIRKIGENLLVLVLGLSLVITLIGMLFTGEILSLSGAEGEILAYATQYLRIIFIGSLFVNFAQSANMLLRGEGKMSIAMGIMAFGAILNIVLDIVMIKFLALGIAGAAYATIISQFIQALITFIYFRKYSQTIQFNHLHLNRDILAQVVAVGVSGMLMQVLSLVQQTLVYNVAAKVGGQESIILIGAIMRYMMFAFIPLWGISQGFQPIAGMNFGAGEFTRLKKSIRLFSGFACSLAVTFWLPFMLFTRQILAMFINNESIIAGGIVDARIGFLTFPLAGIIVVLLTLFQAIGDAKKAGTLVMMRQLFLFVPFLYLISYLIGKTGIYVTFSLTDMIVFILALVMTYKVSRNFVASED